VSSRLGRFVTLALATALAVTVGLSPASARTADTTLKLLETNTTGQAWPILIANFQRVYPDIKIEASYLPGNQLSALLLTQFQAGNAPDIFHVNAGGGTPTNVWPLAVQGKLLALDGSPWIKRIFPPLKKWMSYQGKVYGMPGSIYATGVFYNKSVFSQLGLKIPTKFSDLAPMCRKIRAGGKVPFALGLDASGASNVTLWAQTLMTQWVYGPDPTWTEKRLAKKVTFASSPLWQRALQRFMELKDAGCFTDGAQGTGLQQQQVAFANGQAAMTLLASVQLGALLQVNPNLSYGMFALPADTAKGTLIPIGSAITLVVNKASPNAAAARKFVDFMARPKQAALIARITGGIEPFAASKGDVATFLSPMAPLFKQGKTVLQPFAGWPNNNMIFGTVFPGFQGLFTGQKTPAQILQDMDTTWDNGPQSPFS
jgi:raffinose/stachyose/melibiose transport system substrate-binding protein